MWSKYPNVKPENGQKVLCLIWGTDIFPATFIESSNGKHRGWFPEVDCISVAGDLAGRIGVVNPCFEGDVDYWMEYPDLPGEPVSDSYTLPEEKKSETCAQSADVETVREKIELAIKFGLPIDARMALKEALEALDRIVGILRGSV